MRGSAEENEMDNVRFEKSGPHCYKAFSWVDSAKAYVFEREVYTPSASARETTLLRMLDIERDASATLAGGYSEACGSWN